MSQPRYHATLAGHDIELEFDSKLVFINRTRLFVDGELLDSENVFYGTKELTATLPDGTEVLVRLHSGMVGELDRPQLKTEAGWTDLVARSAERPTA